MEARPCPIIEFFNGTKQMMVPLFQRQYEWGKPNWETLWTDLLERYEDPEGTVTHFAGAIVTAPAKSIPVGVSKYLVIDGQQRLTTVALLLCAMRSLMDPDTARHRKLTRLLINEDDEGLDRYKLLPTQPDRATFVALVEGKGAPTPGARMADAFNYFRRQLQGKDGEGQPLDLDRLVTTLQNRLTVVTIHLNDSDDPYLIFESLNAKGAPLTQADLIRNYLLLRVPASLQQQIYETCWLPMQELKEHLTEYMRQYLMLSGEEVSKSAIYAVLKRRLQALGDDKVRAEIDEMRDVSELYAYIVGTKEDPRPRVERGLARLRRWEVSTASPLVLALMRRTARGSLSEEHLTECIATIESLVVRRFVCGVPTNQLKNIFLSLTKDLPPSDLPSWITQKLSQGTAGRRWPKDAEFRLHWQNWDAYAAPSERCKMLLETLENSFEHKEVVSFTNATIEHVMPQTLTEAWTEALGPNAGNIHERWINCLGNLTLTGYNPELSNSPFNKKRALLAQSHFELNRAIAAETTWGAEQIEARGLALFERATRLWERPASADELADDADDGEDDDDNESPSVTGTVPSILQIRGTKESVRSWAEVAKGVARFIAGLGDPTFENVSAEMPKFLNRDTSAFRRSSKLDRLPNGAYVETNLSAAAIVRWSRIALRHAGVGDEEWSYELRERRSTDLSETERDQIAFWTIFRERLVAAGLDGAAAAPAAQHWMNLNLGRTGVHISMNCSFRDERVGVKLMMHSKHCPELLAKLSAERPAIEGALGHTPNWDPHPNKLVRSIATWRPVANVRNRDQWAGAVDTLLDLAQRYHSTFAGRVKS